MKTGVFQIISGGQTGADRTGLEVAQELGLRTGGLAPYGYRTDEGLDPTLSSTFGLTEHASAQYAPRTAANVQLADGTVIFGVASTGSCLTRDLCIAHKKPWIWNPTAEELRAWLIDHNIGILNVAGNRLRTNPQIVELVRTTLIEALR